MQVLDLAMAGVRRPGTGSKGLQPADAIKLFAASGTRRCVRAAPEAKPLNSW